MIVLGAFFEGRQYADRRLPTASAPLIQFEQSRRPLPTYNATGRMAAWGHVRPIRRCRCGAPDALYVVGVCVNRKGTDGSLARNVSRPRSLFEKNGQQAFDWIKQPNCYGKAGKDACRRRDSRGWQQTARADASRRKKTDIPSMNGAGPNCEYSNNRLRPLEDTLRPNHVLCNGPHLLNRPAQNRPSIFCSG